MLKEFRVLPTEARAKEMKERDFLWCLLHSMLDREEELERLCPQCRSRVEEERCVRCGQPTAFWGEASENSAFDWARFAQMQKGGGT